MDDDTRVKPDQTSITLIRTKQKRKLRKRQRSNEENNEKLPAENREPLKEFYAEDVRKLEKIAGRELGAIWPDFQ